MTALWIWPFVSAIWAISVLMYALHDQPLNKAVIIMSTIGAIASIVGGIRALVAL